MAGGEERGAGTAGELWVQLPLEIALTRAAAQSRAGYGQLLGASSRREDSPEPAGLSRKSPHHHRSGLCVSIVTNVGFSVMGNACMCLKALSSED